MVADEKTRALVQATNRLDAIATALTAAAAHGSDALCEARLAPDMFPLATQVAVVADLCGQLVKWLGGHASVDAPRDSTTIAALQDIVASARAGIASARPDSIDLADEHVVVLPIGLDIVGNGHDFLANWLLPNLYFHAVIVHAILRNAGVAIGKREYLAGIDHMVRPRTA